MARRTDGRPLTDVDREEARQLAGIGAATTTTPAIDLIIDDRAIAVLIDSAILGAPIWFAFKDGWSPERADGAAIFYANELPALRGKTADQLRAIFTTKCAFGLGIVKQ